MILSSIRRSEHLQLALALVSLVSCGTRYASDQPLPGVDCTNGPCIGQERDRLAASLPLRAGCGGEWGLAPERMTLVGAGDRVVLAGRLASADGQLAVGDAAGAVALLAAPAAGAACPDLAPVLGTTAEAAAGAAHSTDGYGNLLVFAGDTTATRSLVVYGGGVWSPHALSPDPSIAVPVPPTEETPVALAVRLPGEQTMVMRSPFTRTGAAPAAPLLGTELFDTAAEPPARSWAAVYAESAWPGLAGILGDYGRLYAFGLPAPDAGSPPSASRVALMGAAGRALDVGLADRMLAASGLPRSTTDAATNQGASIVLLPLRPGSAAPYTPGAILFASGSGLTDSLTAIEDMRRLQVYDPTAGTWTTVGTLRNIRFLATPVLLPDGSVALVGGNDTDLHTYYVDPGRGFSVATGRATLGRARGAGAGVLLADGRVMVGGGLVTISSAREPPDLDVIEPPYLAPGRARPIVAGAPATIAHDTPFSLTVTGGGPPPHEIVLMAFGSSARGYDPNQRLVQLASSPPDGLGNVTVQGPPASWAPPGRYLLFAVADHVPSVGVPVRLTGTTP